jgi:hypothetical protein
MIFARVKPLAAHQISLKKKPIPNSLLTWAAYDYSQARETQPKNLAVTLGVETFPLIP